ncbi:CLUMA_CG008435, isoform A [Clunio marinus]|uniref:CLUMA_CG008435, isoform A n=1 Tax=Clunio marinus TaxID=568069 RepID=A0A1J1I432_9DIPT|nr:CLUMA_CG008435, isoform A [Clunio marinus]
MVLMQMIQDFVYDCFSSPHAISPYQQACSSVSGALITSLLMTPMDVVKTRLQVQQKMLLSNKCYLYCNGLMDHLCPCGPTGSLIPDKQRFNGTMDAFMKISRNEGLRSLWSGLSPTLVLALPTTVLYFVAYEQIRVRLKDLHMKQLGMSNSEDYRIPMIIPLIAGLTARCFAVTVVNPLELIRTKMQSEKMSYTEVGQAFRQMIGQYGMKGLFKGLLPTIMRDAPFSAFYWTSYEGYKRYMGILQPEVYQAFIGGALAGCIAATVTCPFDVIKTHQQIEFGEKFVYNKNGNGSKKKMTGTWQTINNIMRSSGISGFYAGLTPRLFKVVTACAVMLSTYEFGKNFFYDYNVNKYYKEYPQEKHEKESLNASLNANIKL